VSTGSVESNRNIAIHTDCITKTFGKISALNNVSLDLDKGMSVALVGANGAGKTTFMKTICGLSKPSAGRISVLSRVPDLASSKFVSSVAYLDQRHPLYEFFTVEDTIRFGAECNPNWNADEASAALELFQLSRDAKVKGLSGGQRAQLALILAMYKGSQIMLLDEPMASLDPLSRSLARDLVNRTRSQDSLLLISSHIIGELQEMCDFLVLFSRGQVKLVGTFRELVSQWEDGDIVTTDARRIPNSGNLSNDLEGLVNAILLEERYVSANVGPAAGGFE